MRKQTLTPEHKQQIYNLHAQGLTVKEIAEQMRIDNPQQVAGVVRAAQNFGRIDKRPGTKTSAPVQPLAAPALAPAHMSGSDSAILEAPPILPTTSRIVVPSTPPPVMSASPAVPVPPVPSVDTSAPPISRTVQVPRERPMSDAQAQGDGFQGWGSASGFAAGFSNPNMLVRYQVYREEPADGLLGEHRGEFGEAELGRLYGSGLYKILRFSPGIPHPSQVSVRIAPSYGEPRFPRNERSAPAPQRPNYNRWGARPWARSESQGQEEEVRPLERPSLYDYSRHAPNNDATTEAIKALGALNTKALELGEQARRQGPDSFVTKFFGEQQQLWQRQLEENRRQEEDRRRDEEQKWERRQKEAELEHKRRQEDEEKRHDRELTRIKAESEARSKEAEAARKQLLDLEGQKLKVTEQQNKLREDALNDELKRNREQQKEQQERLEVQLKEMQENTQSAISENQARLEKELQREREQLDREQKLKEKGLDKEHELNKQILDIKAQALEAQGTNEIFQVVNNVINKFSGGLNQIIELKKLEVATPDAQVALANKGNSEHKTQESADPRTQQAAGAAAPPAAAGPTNGKAGNGQAAAPAGEVQGEVSMESMIREMVDQKFFKEVIQEWAVHVRTGQDGTTFLNMYREWMCDPNDHEGRKATTMFANFIGPRPWEEFYAIIKDKLDPKIQKIFDTPNAKTFYETFRTLITEQIRAFWEEFGQHRDAVNAGRRAGGAGATEKEPVK